MNSLFETLVENVGRYWGVAEPLVTTGDYLYLRANGSIDVHLMVDDDEHLIQTAIVGEYPGIHPQILTEILSANNPANSIGRTVIGGDPMSGCYALSNRHALSSVDAELFSVGLEEFIHTVSAWRFWFEDRSRSIHSQIACPQRDPENPRDRDTGILLDEAIFFLADNNIPYRTADPNLIVVELGGTDLEIATSEAGILVTGEADLSVGTTFGNELHLRLLLDNFLLCGLKSDAAYLGEGETPKVAAIVTPGRHFETQLQSACSRVVRDVRSISRSCNRAHSTKAMPHWIQT